MTTNTPRIVSTGPVGQVAIDILRPVGEVEIAPDGTEETMVPLVGDAIGIIVRGDGVANSNVIEAAKNLKVIGRTGVGYDSIDVVSATQHNIPVVYTPAAGAKAVAEAAITYMLVLCKRIYYWDQQLKSGNWRSREESKPGELDGAVLGIVGFGTIGQRVAQLAGPFDTKILAFDPYVSPEQAEKLNVELVGLNELLSEADFISIHTPLTKQTRGLINRERLQQVKRGAYLVNLARGGVIESLDVLHEGLLDGTLAAVGLDVFEPEPPDVSHPIFQHPNCLTSPHSLGMTPRAMNRIYESMAQDMVAVINGDRPRFVANPQVFDN